MGKDQRGQILIESVIMLAALLLMLIGTINMCETGLKELHKNSYVKRLNNVK